MTMLLLKSLEYLAIHSTCLPWRATAKRKMTMTMTEMTSTGTGVLHCNFDKNKYGSVSY